MVSISIRKVFSICRRSDGVGISESRNHVIRHRRVLEEMTLLHQALIAGAQRGRILMKAMQKQSKNSRFKR